jgi:hypothetical protein
MLMIQIYVLLQKAAQKILYGTFVKTPLLYSLTYSARLRLAHGGSIIILPPWSRAILPFVKQWIVFTTCNINNYYNTPFKEIDVINWLPTSKSFKVIYSKKTMSQI